jgi:hypothetical protein
MINITEVSGVKREESFGSSSLQRQIGPSFKAQSLEESLTGLSSSLFFRGTTVLPRFPDMIDLEREQADSR